MFPEGRWLEFLIVAVVALIVVGPKDLPVLLRKAGQAMAKLRGMAADFRASFDEMARQSELDELRKEVEAMRQAQLADISAASITSPLAEAEAEIRDGLAAPAASPMPTDAPAAPKRAARPKPKAGSAKPAAARQTTRRAPRKGPAS